MNNRNKCEMDWTRYSRGIVSLVMTMAFALPVSAGQDVFPTWHMDDDIKIDFRNESGELLIRISNHGREGRVISSFVFDPETILANFLTVSFVNFDAPRNPRDEFRLAADGVIGMNSEMFGVTRKLIGPGEDIVASIDVIKAMQEVKNDRLQKYLARNESNARLSFSIHLRAVGINSGALLKYVFPEMTLRNEGGNLVLDITKTDK